MQTASPSLSQRFRSLLIVAGAVPVLALVAVWGGNVASLRSRSNVLR